MNYITQIKAFQEVAQDKQLSTGQIALYHALLYINNRCAWAEWFTVANLSLELNSGLSRNGIAKNRNVLKQLGLIDFKSNGTKATQYSISDLEKNVSSSVQASVQSSVQDSVQDSVQSSVQSSGTLNKLNETKLNNITPLPPKGEKSEVFKSFANGEEVLLLALQDYEKMRKAIKKPMTDRAKSMLLTELTKLSTDPKTQVAILEQSILHNWQTVYALKTDKSEPQTKDRWEGINLD